MEQEEYQPEIPKHSFVPSHRLAFYTNNSKSREMRIYSEKYYKRTETDANVFDLPALFLKPCVYQGALTILLFCAFAISPALSQDSVAAQ